MSSQSIKSFTVYDATLFSGKSSSAPWKTIRGLYSGNLWRANEDRSLLPNRDNVHQLALSLTDDSPVFLDIEHWPVKRYADGLYRENLITIAKWVKRSNPDLKIGYYDIVPRSNYNDAIRPITDPQYSQWLSDCRMVADIADHVDVIFPNLYTYVDNPIMWRVYAERNILEAYRYRTKCKVIPFLWPQYHESHPVLGLQYIKTDDWIDQLNHVYALADGVVIWGGYQQAWNESAPWWIATKTFIEQKQTNF